MQTLFFSNKTNIIKLLNWIETENPDILFICSKTGRLMGLQEFETGSLGDSYEINLTFKDSLFLKASTNPDINKGELVVLGDLYSVEFSFGYSLDEVYQVDFSMYEPKEDYFPNIDREMFYQCRLFVFSYLEPNLQHLKYQDLYDKIVDYMSYHSTCYKTISLN